LRPIDDYEFGFLPTHPSYVDPVQLPDLFGFGLASAWLGVFLFCFGFVLFVLV
jgi:hypothetical protein